MERLPAPPVSAPYQPLFELVRAGFATRRKMLRRALAGVVSPEAFAAARHYPVGRLASFQRHKARLWTTYNYTVGRFGAVDAGFAYRYDSPLSYSLVATGLPLAAAVPLAIATGAGSGAQRAIGTGVLGGMVMGTFLGLFFIPLFFVVIERLFKPKHERHHTPPHATAPVPAHD